MNGGEIGIVRAGAETGELGEMLVKHLRMMLRRGPDLPVRGIGDRLNHLGSIFRVHRAFSIHLNRKRAAASIVPGDR